MDRGSRKRSTKYMLGLAGAACTLTLAGCAGNFPIAATCEQTAATIDAYCSIMEGAVPSSADDPSGPRHASVTPGEISHHASPAAVIAAPDKVGETLTPSLSSKLLGAQRGDTIPRPKANGPLTLADVVRGAIRNSTQLGIATAGRMESEASIRAARAAYRPTFEIGGGTGQGNSGTLQTTILPSRQTRDYFDPKNTTGAWRNDLRLTGSMMIYDFGAVDADVERAMSAREAAVLREKAAAEEAAFNAAQLYARIIQSRELVALAEENLVALRGIAKLIETNVQNGNATQADIQRVEARVLDAESARVDQDLELKSAIERFVRLVNLQPGELRQPPDLSAALPALAEQAIQEAIKKNPVVIANAAIVAAARAEAEALKAVEKPRLTLDTSAQSKTYRGQTNKTEVDLSTMLTFSYRLMDGGASAAKYDQSSARLLQAQVRDLETRESLEADLRQQLMQHAAARAKREGLLAGVRTSSKARELYQEQFMGGKRTLLELLEVQNAYYSARYNSIVNASDLRVSTFAILRSMGRLSQTILGET